MNEKEMIQSADINPDTPKWALIYVIAEHPIPEKWRLEFYKELCSEEEGYKKALEDAVRYHGVRWTKD